MDWQPILSGVGIGISRPCAVTGTAAPATQWYRGGLPMNAHCVAALTTPPLGDSRRAAIRRECPCDRSVLDQMETPPPSSSTGRMREVVPGLIESVSALDALLHKPGHGKRRFDGVGRNGSRHLAGDSGGARQVPYSFPSRRPSQFRAACSSHGQADAMGHPAPPDGIRARTRAQDVTHTGRRK